MTHHAWRFTSEKIQKRIELIRPLIRRNPRPLPNFTLELLEHADANLGTGTHYGTVDWNSYWAGQDAHFVLRSDFEVPAEFTNPALYLPLGVAGDIWTNPEALVRIDDDIICSADRYHQLVPLQTSLADGIKHTLVLQGWTGLTGWPPNPDNPERVQIRCCSVVDLNPDLRHLVTLADVTMDVANSTQGDSRIGERLLSALDRAFVTLDTRYPLEQEFTESISIALEQLQADVLSAGAPIDATLHAIGHAHMDVAYLWPIAQIRQKNARTSSNVLRLMETYPNFRFSHSLPQLYDYTATDFPEIFEQIRKRVSEGRWEVMGGMWVEPDCNIPSGESLVRQIKLGREYFLEEFGDVETPVLWLPDTFGFPWSLPQLMRQSGLTAFVTSKLNWNQYNQMPSSTTWWQGLDGSRVLAHILTTPRPVQYLPFPTNYKSDLSAEEVIGTWTKSTTGASITHLPIAYGYGDGGGGPNEELIHKVQHYKAMPGAPAVRMSTVRGALTAMQEQAENLPVWNGDFYVEGHRGTLTSQA